LDLGQAAQTPESEALPWSYDVAADWAIFNNAVSMTLRERM
jgi:hypothetical protein